MRKTYLVALPPGAGKTRTVLQHALKTAGGNIATLCRNLLVLGPNNRVERVWLRELAIIARTAVDPPEMDIRHYPVRFLREFLERKGCEMNFLSFTELNRRARMTPSAFIVIDEWHRLHAKNPKLLVGLKTGPLGNHTYFVSATPLNPVMEQEHDELVEHPTDDNGTIYECRHKALTTIAELTGTHDYEQFLEQPFDKAIKRMGVVWLKRANGWVAPKAGQQSFMPDPLPMELDYFKKTDYANTSDWKSKEAAWAIGLVRTRHQSKTFFLNPSDRGRRLVFGYKYVQPHIVATKRKTAAADWLLNEHSRVRRLLDLLQKSGVITSSKGGRYTLTKKKALLFCVHKGVARGLQLALQQAIDTESKDDIFCDVHEDFSESHQAGFMGKGTAPYILIATDKLSESIDLHGDCGILIHYELPWSPLRLLQRVGRLTRLHVDKKFRDAEVYHIIIPGSVEEERVNRLVRRTALLHDEGAWPQELYGKDKENWQHVAKAIIGSGPSMHLQEVIAR